MTTDWLQPLMNLLPANLEWLGALDLRQLANPSLAGVLPANDSLSFSPQALQLAVGLLVGIGLSASSGLRIFIPPLVLCVAAQVFHWALPPAFAWANSPITLIVLGTAAAIEIAAYFIPWLDNVLDHAAGPAAVAAGTLMTAALTSHLDPALQWPLALIAGGGTAGTVQSLTQVTRLASTATTAGLLNPSFALLETIFSVGLTLLTLVFPLLSVVLLIGLAFAVSTVVVRVVKHLSSSRQAPTPPKA
ncbi:MAG: DUF4126 domain-containing protein [Vampirovibrionales bacterium]